MLDINFIRDNPDKVKQGISAKGYDASLVDKVLELDKERKKIITLAQELSSKRNQISTEVVSEAIKVARGITKDSLQPDVIKRAREIKEQRKKYKAEEEETEQEFKEALLKIPNLPLERVPEGDETKNEVIKPGKPPKFDFTPRDHVELGEILDIIDIPRAVKVSGTRFGYLKNEGVLLEFALVQFALETLVKEGFIPIVPPALIKKEITEGLGYWHGGGNENYYFVRDYEMEGDKKGKPLDLYLVGTGEHSVAPMYSDEVLSAKELPKRYVAFSPCFRREAGSYGKDVKGILRVHQFDKVEMVAFVKPEDDEQERRKLLGLAEGMMKSLGLPYQTVKLASGD